MASASVPAKTPRRDPRPRTHDGANKGVGLINARPDRHYVGVDQHGGAVGDYQARGYEIEVAEEAGVRWSRRTCKLGEPLEYMGHVLMSIDIEEYQDIVQHGEHGEGGQKMADQIEAAILDKSGAQRDLMRGLNGGYIRMEHKIEPLTAQG